MRQSLDQQWKWMDASIPLQTLFRLEKQPNKTLPNLHWNTY